MVAINIETTLDTVCPFCYLGKRNLEKAIETYRAAHPEDEFEVSYKPFYLNPTARKTGTSSFSGNGLHLSRRREAFLGGVITESQRYRDQR